jgi:O-antigen/teichoic acid export membrane protein
VSAHQRLEAHRQKRQTLASTAILIIGGSSYFSMLVGMLRSVLVMRLVGPAPQGVRRIVDLILKYLGHAHLGILHGTNKELPICLGQNDAERVQEVEDVGVTWVVGLTLIASVGMLIAGLLNPTGQRVTSIAIMIGAGLLIVGQTATLYRTVARAWGNFKALGIVAGIETVTTFSFTVLGAYGFYHFGRADQHREYAVLGAMLGGLLAGCVSLILLGLLAPIHVRVRFDRKLGWQLAKAGLPITGMILADTLLRTVDGAIITASYGSYWFGLYSMAMQMAGYLYAIPEAAGFVMWPRILHAFGAADGDQQALRRQIVLPTMMSGMFMPAIAGTAYILLPPVVNAVLPKFMPAMGATQILALASVFLALPMATNSLLIAQNKGHHVVLYKLSGAAAVALGCLLLAHHNVRDLTSFAVVASFGYAVAAVLSVGIVLPQYEDSFVRRVTLLFGTFSPFAWACCALLLSRLVGSIFVLPDGTSFVWAVLRLGLFLGLMIPVLLFGNRQTHLLHELRVMRESWNRSEVIDHETDA